MEDKDWIEEARHKFKELEESNPCIKDPLPSDVCELCGNRRDEHTISLAYGKKLCGTNIIGPFQFKRQHVEDW